MRKLTFIFLLCTAGYYLSAQTRIQDTTVTLNSFIQKVQKAYSGAAYLGFKINYLYANAERPDQYLESMAGEVQMDKNRSRLSIDGTETVLTGKYAIQVIPEDKIIYISSAGRAAMPNPVGMLDSVFAHIQGVSSTIRHEGLSDILALHFPPGQVYNQLEITIDVRTGFFEEIDYDLSTPALVNQDMIERPGHPGPYQERGKVKIVFSDYRQGHFDDRLFSEDKFFTKTAGQFLPTGRYKDYHIYLASSNL